MRLPTLCDRLGHGVAFAMLTLPLLSAQDQHHVPSTQSVRSQYNAVLEKPYRKWLDEDVRWIITEEERIEFDKLTTNQQRDAFVVAFWESRNPNPGSVENQFKEAHYRRLAYSNEQFAANVPGYKTDRGRIYIVYGPPDEVERHSRATASANLSYAYEVWRYNVMKGVGHNIFVKFVDVCDCGDYRMTVDPTAKHPTEIN